MPKRSLIRRPVFPNRRVALAVGLAGGVLFWLGISDAYEGRGGKTPGVLRPVTFW